MPLLDLQRAMADLLLEPRPAFKDDPCRWAAGKGLGEADQRAFTSWAPRLWTYRELVEFALEDPLLDAFPLSRALLRGNWDDALRAFLAARAIPSPYYRDIAPAFVAWVAESGWGQEEFPALLSLLHWEQVEMDVLWAEDEPLPVPDSDSGSGARVCFRPLRHLAYPFRVHEATLERPEPPAGDTFLLAWRDDDDDFQSLALSPRASALVGRLLAGDTLGEATKELTLDMEEAMPLLEDLRAREVLVGCRKNEKN